MSARGLAEAAERVVNSVSMRARAEGKAEASARGESMAEARVAEMAEEVGKAEAARKVAVGELEGERARNAATAQRLSAKLSEALMRVCRAEGRTAE